MNRTETEGKAKNLKGRSKQAAGAAMANRRLEKEGVTERMEGAVKQRAGKVRRKVGEAIEDLGKAIKH